MQKKNGFTLVELLVVIVLIGLLAVIAVPSGLAISRKVKIKMLSSKIELIESEAIVWGEQHKDQLNGSCIIDVNAYTNCIIKTIGELLVDNAIEPDFIDDSGTKYLKNPTNEEKINDCEINIYVKNKRVYANYAKTVNGTLDESKCFYIDD